MGLLRATASVAYDKQPNTDVDSRGRVEIPMVWTEVYECEQSCDCCRTAVELNSLYYLPIVDMHSKADSAGSPSVQSDNGLSLDAPPTV